MKSEVYPAKAPKRKGLTFVSLFFTDTYIVHQVIWTWREAHHTDVEQERDKFHACRFLICFLLYMSSL